MLKKMRLVILVLVIVCCAAVAVAEETGLFPDLETIEEMENIVGIDIDPGEYIFFALPGETGTFHLKADRKGSETISEKFETNTILTVAEGDYLTIENCIGVRSDDYYAGKRTGSGLYGSMLKVGYDLAPGRYEFAVAPGKTGVCKIWMSSSHRKEDLLESFEGKTLPAIVVEDEQYLQLIDCCIAGGDNTSPFNQSEVRSGDTVVIVDGKNPAVRSMPSTKGEVIGEAKSGEMYMVLDSDLRWYKIRLENGMEGWIVKYYAEVNK